MVKQCRMSFYYHLLLCPAGYSWYLDKVAATVESALKDSGACQVDLIGHSAGGWLGRAFLGDPKYMERLETIAAENVAKAAAVANGGGASTRSIGGAVSTESAEGLTVNLSSTLSMDTDVTLPLPKASRASAVGAAVPVGSRPNSVVRQMVTLGTPQRPPPPEKMKDMTGGTHGQGLQWHMSIICTASCLFHGMCQTSARKRTKRGDGRAWMSLLHCCWHA